MEEEIREFGQLASIAVPEFPKLNPWITVIELRNGVVQLRSENYLLPLTHPLIGQAFLEIRDLLDGRHQKDDICKQSPSAQSSTVHFLLKILTAGAALATASEPLTGAPPISGRVCYIGEKSLNSKILEDLAPRMAARALIVSNPTLNQIEDFHIDELGSPDLIVSAFDFSKQDHIMALNLKCLDMSTRWLSITKSMTFARLGPTVIPFQSACYRCMDHRLASSELEMDHHWQYLKATQLQRIENNLASHSLETTLAGQAIPEIIRLLTGISAPQTIGSYFQYDISRPGASHHRILKVPRCSHCAAHRTYRKPWDSFS